MDPVQPHLQHPVRGRLRGPVLLHHPPVRHAHHHHHHHSGAQVADEQDDGPHDVRPLLRLPLHRAAARTEIHPLLLRVVAASKEG